GPTPGGTVCDNRSSCTTLYLSSLDSTSTATVEENGPVRAVVKADGTHKDASGHGYMKFTCRMFFYKGKTAVKIEVSLRNADETNDIRGDFNSAAKGFWSYELRLAPQLGSGREFAIGGRPGAPIGGILKGEAYVYQAYSDDMQFADWNAHNCT